MNYRQQRSYLNCEKAIYPGGGIWDFPSLSPADVDFTDAGLFGFNYAIGEKEPENKVVHFYLDDYQFERVWSSPERYLDLLSRFRAVCTPDFSQYTDFPRIVNMFNHYRKQWCGAFWQEHGITVIPTLCWSDEASFEYCFDGIPEGATVTVSTVGAWKHRESRELWLEGYRKALEALKPKQVLLVGKCFPGIKSIPFGGTLITEESPNIRALSEKRKRNEGE